MRHMPHGVFLHAAPKSSKDYYLLYKPSTNNAPSRNILHFNHPLVLFSDLCASTKSILCNPYSLRTTAFLLLSKPHENSGTNYYARNHLLAKNNIDNTQLTWPKLLAPNQGCCTIHRRSEWTNDSSGISYDLLSWCISRNFSAITKSTLRKTSLVKTSILSYAYHSCWNSQNNFICRKWLLATNSINYTQRTSPKVPAPYPGCPANQKELWTDWRNIYPLVDVEYSMRRASSYRRWWCTSRDLRPFTRSFLMGLLGITILQSLSPS